MHLELITFSCFRLLSYVTTRTISINKPTPLYFQRFKVK